MEGGQLQSPSRTADTVLCRDVIARRSRGKRRDQHGACLELCGAAHPPSLVQATTNVIMIRFSIFIISSIVLLALTLCAAMLVY
jgi:hypothetical protein